MFSGFFRSALYFRVAAGFLRKNAAKGLASVLLALLMTLTTLLHMQAYPFAGPDSSTFSAIAAAGRLEAAPGVCELRRRLESNWGFFGDPTRSSSEEDNLTKGGSDLPGEDGFSISMGVDLSITETSPVGSGENTGVSPPQPSGKPPGIGRSGPAPDARRFCQKSMKGSKCTKKKKLILFPRIFARFANP